MLEGNEVGLTNLFVIFDDGKKITHVPNKTYISVQVMQVNKKKPDNYKRNHNLMQTYITFYTLHINSN
jgi:hypothetical protein